MSDAQLRQQVAGLQRELVAERQARRELVDATQRTVEGLRRTVEGLCKRLDAVEAALRHERVAIGSVA